MEKDSVDGKLDNSFNIIFKYLVHVQFLFNVCNFKYYTLIQILKIAINIIMTISDNENMAFQDLSMSHGMNQVELWHE